MMFFRKKTAHGLLGLPDRRRPSPPRMGLGWVAEEPPPPSAHVVEASLIAATKPPSSSSHAPPSRSPSPSPMPPTGGIDSCVCGLSSLYDCNGCGGGRTSLELCTESLGFESSCEMASEEWEEEEICRRRSVERKPDAVQHSVNDESTGCQSEKKEFPPPLPWLSDLPAAGRLSRSFLRAVRGDGRLLLTEVRIERPEIFRALRHDGRLRLELVGPRRQGDVAEERTQEEAVQEEERTEEKQQRREILPAAASFRSGRCQDLAGDGSPASSTFWNNRFLAAA